MSQYLGDISAYALAVSQGYTGTEEEYAELMASYADVGQIAVDAKDAAVAAKTAAQTAATTATNKASEATTAATTATTKAGEASTSASTATSAKDTAVSASQTATTKATEATTAAATATSAATTATTAKDDAVSAKTAAQTAQTGAETAAASVQSSAAQIATNAEDISQLKSDLQLVIDSETVSGNRSVTSEWNYGAINNNGSSSATQSYIYSAKIAVNAGDVVKCRKSNNAGLVSYSMLCAYNGDIVVPSAGTSATTAFPYVVPSGVTGIIITLAAAYLVENCYFYIEYTEEQHSAKAYSKSQTYSKAEVDALIDDTVKSVNGITPDSDGDVKLDLTRTVVDQITVIEQTQKEVVTSQVDVVDSARNAANNGVLPSNDGTTNYNNLQAMLDVGGTIVVDVPGVYEINGMLEIGSDTELIFGKQVQMKQINSTGGFIINKGAATGVYNENIRIYGLHLICNGMTGDTGSYRYGIRGKLGFLFVKRLVLDSIYVDDIPNATYFIHISGYDNVLIQNCHIEGDKDGIHSSGGNNLTIRNCYFNTFDDPIAFCVQNYPVSIAQYSDATNILIENCIDESPAGLGGAKRGRSILFYGGAWNDWESGNTYRNGDTIVASNDCVYRFVSDTAISDATVVASTVEPSHRSGRVTESDGCTWHFVQDTPIYNVRCRNVIVRNFIVKCPRTDVMKFHNDDSTYTRSIYPTAIMPPHENFTFENIVVLEPSDYLIGVLEPVDKLRINNCKALITYAVRVHGTYLVNSDNSDSDIMMYGNEFYKASNGLVLILSQQANRVTNVKAYGNYANQTMYNSVSYGTVNMIANDLF